MAGTVALIFEGPQSLIQELEREVSHGDVVDVPADLAPRLLQSAGFREASAGEAKRAHTAEEKAAEKGTEE